MRAVLLVALVACAASESPGPVAPAIPAAPITASIPALVPDPAPPVLRLPGDVKPIRAALDLTVFPDQPTLSGTVHIPADVVTPTRVVWLNATDLTIHHAELDGKPARLVTGNDDFIGLTVDRVLPLGSIAIDLAFTAKIDPTRSRGVYREREGNEPYIYTFFEPIDARRAFPCFDEPSYKIPWQVTLHVRQADVALGNAAVLRETAEPGGLKKVELAATRPLPSYLVAFVVGPFEIVDGGTAGRAQTPIRFVLPRGRAGELGYARQITPKVVAALEDYFDMAYPYGKLDVAVVPRYWGTMEHPGLVALGQPLTFIHPDEETIPRKEFYANIAIHELAHYWFGDYVTMAWWDDTWLNEALGTWSDLNITEAAEPSWRVRDDRVDLSASAMAADEALATQAIRQPVTTREAIAASFDNAITFFSTIGGSTVSCAIGLAVLDVVQEERLQEHAAEVGGALIDALRLLAGRHPLVGDVRGSGLFLGVELVKDRGTLEPATGEASDVVNRMRERGILLGTDGPFANVLKIRPPMPFTRENADHLAATLDEVLRQTVA